MDRGGYLGDTFVFRRSRRRRSWWGGVEWLVRVLGFEEDREEEGVVTGDGASDQGSRGRVEPGG